jgi:aminomethyltransferase
MSDWQQVWNSIARTGIVPSTIETFDYLRIKDGNPRFGHELTLDYIPLEANLWDDVSFNKGCYTGQEIIARMESRGRLAKKLVRLRPESSLESGIELTMGGKKVGSITSAANGPDGPVVLGFVKSAALQNEQPLTANSITVNLVDTVV